MTRTLMASPDVRQPALVKPSGPGVLSILALCRMSVGCAGGTTSTALTSTPRLRRPRVGHAPRELRPGGGAGFGNGRRGLHHHNHRLGSRRSNPPGDGSHPYAVQAFDGLFCPDWRHHSPWCRHNMGKASLHPKSASGVEVSRVARAVPSGNAGALPLGQPEPVIGLLDVRRADQDFAGDPPPLSQGSIRLRFHPPPTEQRPDRLRVPASPRKPPFPAPITVPAAASLPPLEFLPG